MPHGPPLATRPPPPHRCLRSAPPRVRRSLPPVAPTGRTARRGPHRRRARTSLPPLPPRTRQSELSPLAPLRPNEPSRNASSRNGAAPRTGRPRIGKPSGTRRGSRSRRSLEPRSHRDGVRLIRNRPRSRPSPGPNKNGQRPRRPPLGGAAPAPTGRAHRRRNDRLGTQVLLRGAAREVGEPAPHGAPPH